MRYRCGVHVPSVAILTLLLIATLSVALVHSSSQQEVSIQNMGEILVQDNSTEAIFFEYGGETGVLQPPLDNFGSFGSGDKTGSYVSIGESPVKSGNKSVEIYQVPPNKSDAQRRVGMWYIGSSHNRKEFYLSWWVWFPSGFKEMVNTWANLGGISKCWGPSTDPWKHQTAWRFIVSPSGEIGIWHRLLDNSAYGHNSGEYVQNHYEEWVHFQIYVKWATDGTGVYRAWLNDNLFVEETNLTNDPAAVILPSETFRNGDAPDIEIQIYTAPNNNEIWYWVDDIVAATEKVAEIYTIVSE